MDTEDTVDTGQSHSGMSSGAGDSEGEHSSAVRCGHGDTQQSTSNSDRDIVSVINIYFDLFITVIRKGFLVSWIVKNGRLRGCTFCRN